MIRELQPKAVINNRGFDEGDFGTPERDFDSAATRRSAFDRPTEACQSVGMESWGYRKDEDYYTDRHLIRSIDRYLARDANYLLNVGPTAEGVDSRPSRRRSCGASADWYRAVQESLEGVEPASHLTSNRNVLLTRAGTRSTSTCTRTRWATAVKLKPLAMRPAAGDAAEHRPGRCECAVDLAPQRPRRAQGLPAAQRCRSTSWPTRCWW